MPAGTLTLGGIKYEIIAEDKTKDGTDSAADNLKRVEDQSVLTTANLAKVTAAFAALTAISATLVVASDRVVDLEKITSHAAVTQGVSTRAMYEYVQSLSSAADPQEEVGATMAYLSRTGLKMSDDLTSVYETMDQIGDATGTTSTAISQELIPAFTSLGMESQDVAKYADLLSYAVNTSLFNISDWSMMLRRNGESLLAFKVPLEDTIAISMKLSELGLPARKILTVMNDAFKEMGANTEIAAEGEKKLLEIQQKLTDAQDRYNRSLDDGTKLTRHLYEDLQNAGGDVSATRRIILTYQSQKRDIEESNTEKTVYYEAERDALIKERDDLQEQITAAKNAPTPTLTEAIAKQLPNQITVEELNTSIEKSKTESVGAAERYGAAGEIVTGSEKAAYTTDQLLQAVGKNIGADTASSMAHLRDISGAVSVISGILTIIQGFSATTALMTTATAAGSINPIIAGLGFGALGVTAMEATGLTGFQYDLSGGTSGSQGMIEQAGATTAQIVSSAGKNFGAAISETGSKKSQAEKPVSMVPPAPASTKAEKPVSMVPPAPASTKAEKLTGANTTTIGPITIDKIVLSEGYTMQNFMKDLQSDQYLQQQAYGIRRTT